MVVQIHGKIFIKTNKWLLIYYLVVSIFSSCNQFANDDNKLLGEWCFVDYGRDTVYNELYISEDYFLYYLDMNGFLPLQKYKISQDSLLFYYEINGKDILQQNYYPKFYFLNKDSFILEYNKRTTLFIRIKNNLFPPDSLKSEDDNYKFDYYFYKRRNKFLFRIGMDVDTALNFLHIEEESIEPIENNSPAKRIIK